MNLAEATFAQDVELGTALRGDRVHRPCRQPALSLGADGLDQALRFELVKRVVEGPGPDLAPRLDVDHLGDASDLMSVHRSMRGEGAEHQQANRSHGSSVGAR